MTVPIHVLVVDDSALVRQVLLALLTQEPGVEVTTAADALIAERKIQQRRPDVIVLDLEMPKVHGLTFLQHVMATNPIPVIICSSLTAAGTDTALQALEYGAVDVVGKPRLGVRDFLHESAVEFIDKVRAAASANVTRRVPVREVATRHTADVVMPLPPAPKARAGTGSTVIAIGASTGGTEALRELLVPLPTAVPGIVIVQHMPAAFTGPFATRLNRLCRIEVKEAQDGDEVLPGHALIAPGSHHLLLRRQAGRYVVELNDGPFVSRHRPSVDVLFRSVAAAAGPDAVGILMTGMGDDGAAGLLEMLERGASTYAQDEASSVVWGMPGSAVAKGAAQQVLSVAHLTGQIAARGAAAASARATPRRED